MALWEIRYADGSYAGYRNSGETAEQAVAEWNEDHNRPQYVHDIHSEMMERYLRGEIEIWDFDHYTCPYRTAMRLKGWVRWNRTPATQAIRMREIWMDCGYARVPWVEAA